MTHTQISCDHTKPGLLQTTPELELIQITPSQTTNLATYMAPYSAPTARWNALTTRDPFASHAFIYSVTSTKIYCRPTCPARLARRANVRFHDTAAEAEAAGNRACMRCRPGTSDESAGDPQKIAVAKACELVRGEGGKWSVKNLAKEVGLTESHFCRVFKKLMGVTVGEYRASLGRGEEGVVAVPKNSALAMPSWEDLLLSSTNIMRAQDDFVHLDSSLANDWLDFSGPETAFDKFDTDSGLDVMSTPLYESSPGIISDASTPVLDDGFQFVDYEAFNEFVQ